MYNLFNTFRVILNSTKMILKDIEFSIKNRTVEHTFLSNREHWYAYIVGIMDTKLLKTKTAKDLKTGQNNVSDEISENTGFHKIHISCISRCH